VDDASAESPPAAPNLVIAVAVDDGPPPRDEYDDDDDVAYADPRRVDPMVDRIRPLTRNGDSAARPAVVLAARPVMLLNTLDGVASEVASVEDMEPDVIVRPTAGVGRRRPGRRGGKGVVGR
jgi:hypothetical protein